MRHPAPPTLPESVGGDSAIEMDPGIVVHVIPDGGIQKAIRRGYDVTGQIGARVRCYHRSGSRLWIFHCIGVGPIGRCLCSWGTSWNRGLISGGDRLCYPLGRRRGRQFLLAAEWGPGPGAPGSCRRHRHRRRSLPLSLLIVGMLGEALGRTRSRQDLLLVVGSGFSAGVVSGGGLRGGRRARGW